MKESEFTSWLDYQKFEHHVKEERRYVHDIEAQRLLRTVLMTSESRKTKLPKERYLWRAQLGNSWRPIYQSDCESPNEEEIHVTDISCALPSERMKPCMGSASEGRANPKGIPCLYLSKDKETAMSEVRPWIGSLISVGQFRTIRDLELVNCTLHHKGFIFHFSEPGPLEREQAVWSDIGRAFSRPVNPSDTVADYVPTQIIAELFKSNGIDGIVYSSSLGKNLNVVLFDLDSAELMSCSLFGVKTVSFTFDEADETYYVGKRKA